MFRQTPYLSFGAHRGFYGKGSVAHGFKTVQPDYSVLSHGSATYELLNVGHFM